MNDVKTEIVYREMLYRGIELKERRLTQRGLAKVCRVSPGLVNFAIKPLRRMGAIAIQSRSFVLIDPWKALMYWCSIRVLQREITYSTHVRARIEEIEAGLPRGCIPTAYTAYRERFDDVPSDYSEVYVYGDRDEFVKRFGEGGGDRPNLIVLKGDGHLLSLGQAPLAQIYADLWNIETWYARRFLTKLGEKIEALIGGE